MYDVRPSGGYGYKRNPGSAMPSWKGTGLFADDAVVHRTPYTVHRLTSYFVPKKNDRISAAVYSPLNPALKKFRPASPTPPVEGSPQHSAYGYLSSYTSLNSCSILPSPSQTETVRLWPARCRTSYIVHRTLLHTAYFCPIYPMHDKTRVQPVHLHL
jgi:hypothetical protein